MLNKFRPLKKLSFLLILMSCVPDQEDTRLQGHDSCDLLNRAIRCLDLTDSCQSIPDIPTPWWVRIMESKGISDQQLIRLSAVDKQFRDAAFEVMKRRLKRRLSEKEFESFIGLNHDLIGKYFKFASRASYDPSISVPPNLISSDLDHLLIDPKTSTRLISSHSDRSIKVWDLSLGKVTKNIEDAFDLKLNEMWFDPNHREKLITLSDDYVVKLWDLNQEQPLVTTITTGGRIESAQLHPTNANHLLVWDWDLNWNRQIHIWDIENHDLLKSISIDFDFTIERNILFDSADSNLAIFWTEGSEVIFKNLSSNQNFKILNAHDLFVQGVRIDPTNSRRMITWGDQGSIKLWNLDPNPELLRNFEGHQLSVSGILFHPTQSHQMISWDRDGLIKLWDLNQQIEVKTLGPTNGVTQSVSFDPSDSNKLISFSNGSGNESATIKIWDLSQDFEEYVVSLGNLPYEAHVRFMLDPKDSNLLYTWGIDESIRIWDISQNKLIKTIAGHRETVEHVIFDPQNSYRLLSWSRDKILHEWDLWQLTRHSIRIDE